ncbi:putative inorganic phosphate cotransporter isoform X2 [Drosophila tropicalis]|uniref:putative inorganic phosphate cotransporter isoform X2 n=1 Tax=Drosophila tropicalis TaxID=46794 RepID=UPI0035AC0B38
MYPIQQKLREFFNYLCVQQRVILCFFSFLAIINAYTMRLCLDVSLNRIVLDCKEEHVDQRKTKDNWILDLAVAINQTAFLVSSRLAAGKEEKLKPQPAQQQQKRLEPMPHTTGEWHSHTGISCAELWSRQSQSLVIISFYAGYMLTHIPGGRLAERYGGKWILGSAILLAAILTLLTPSAVRVGGPSALVAIRLLIGLCEGPTFPAVSAMLAQWVPEQERGFLGSCVLSGGEIGITLLQLVSGLVMAEQDWPVAFYVVGGGAVFWFAGFAMICYSKPDNCPYIKSEEKDYIKSQVSDTLIFSAQDGNAMATIPPPPWRSMLLSTPVWALISASMQHDWSRPELSQELQDVLQELKAQGSTMWDEVVASLTLTAPHIGNWVASLSTGSLSDFLISEGILSRTQTRRLMSWLVFICGSMYMVYVKANFGKVWSCLAVGAYYAGIKLLPLDMSPNYAGTLMGISNGLGSLPNLLMPYLKELEEKYAIVGSIRAALWLICTSYISGDVQSYNQLGTHTPIAN